MILAEYEFIGQHNNSTFPEISTEGVITHKTVQQGYFTQGYSKFCTGIQETREVKYPMTTVFLFKNCVVLKI